MVQKVLLALTLLGTANGFGNPLNHLLYKRQGPQGRLFANIPASVDLEWHSCGTGAIESKYECARLSVPLDYKRPENGLRAIVPILKYSAESNVPYKGSVLYNPGGPGQPVAELIYLESFVENLRSEAVGPGWDILLFDPRGIGYSIPRGACDITPGTFIPERQNATTLPTGTTLTGSNSRRRRRAPTFPPNNDEVVFNMLIPDDPPSRKTIAFAEADSWSLACKEHVSQYNQAGPHMNTAVVATDMLSIAQALAREKKEESIIVNYYGTSYGTLLGQYFATLYPDNVGRFYLDGVVDADTWVTQDAANTSIIHVDKIWSKFFSECYDAGPTKCSMFTGRNSHAIRDRFNAITAKLNATKYELEGSPLAPTIKSSLWTIKGLAFGGGYGPKFIWPLLAGYIVSVEKLLASIDSAGPDSEASRKAFSEFQKKAEPVVDVFAKLSESFYQVACTDGRDLRGVEITDADWKAWKDVSKIIGHYKLAERIKCTKWQIRPSWEWYGPVGGKTRTPILFAGTTLDLITPLKNSEKARTLFKGAKMLYVDEIMHTVSGTNNKCAARHVLAYFQNGTLPGHDNRCKGETVIFG
ncbi:hypothetical protein TWF506_001635 [Arthrobotrys conoides]|uniref:Peptidase S33 tripeptidyl aminopeptidase-like C-terminal domain-containing protein n=1 Tax=Arthrobotrys conoides TaxID=74498 RepID=A0AAN8RRG3_9PEZI